MDLEQLVTSSVLVGQIWESPDISQADSITDGGEDVLFLTGPVPTFGVLITIIHIWVLLSEAFKAMMDFESSNAVICHQNSSLYGKQRLVQVSSECGRNEIWNLTSSSTTAGFPKDKSLKLLELYSFIFVSPLPNEKENFSPKQGCFKAPSSQSPQTKECF